MKTPFDKRMKSYENKDKLEEKVPVIIRIDGRAFHSYTNGMDKPFDKGMQQAMIETLKYLVENVDVCKFGYTQSDEISLLLLDDDKPETQPFFGNKIQKMTSISASLATAKFNTFKLRDDKLAIFDAKVFNIPKNEVLNYFIWRQSDCIRNSINMVARTVYSQAKLNNKSKDTVLKMLSEKGIEWSEFETSSKHGVACLKNGNEGILDFNIPVFSKEADMIKNILNRNQKE